MLPETSRGPKGRCRARRRGRGAPERCADDEAAQTASGGGVQRRQGSSSGRRRAWRGPAARERPTGLGSGGRLRNGAARRALTGRGRTAATLGRVRRGGGLRWRKARKADAWAVGMSVRRSGVDGRDERRAGEKNSIGGRRLCFKGERRGGGRRGKHNVEAERERERGRGGAWARRGIGAASARPRRVRAARCRATMEDGGVGVTQVDVADRRARTRRGPGRQRLGAA
jgi:hypothetical protein